VVFFAETWIPRLQAEIAGPFIVNTNACGVTSSVSLG